jgi:ribonucleotide monophosphatase NagD (HAD superfamily)
MQFLASFSPSVLILASFFADIAGANAAGWSSVLVRTGVYDPVDGPPAHSPTHEAENVEAAVQWAIDREVKRSV